MIFTNWAGHTIMHNSRPLVATVLSSSGTSLPLLPPGASQAIWEKYTSSNSMKTRLSLLVVLYFTRSDERQSLMPPFRIFRLDCSTLGSQVIFEAGSRILTNTQVRAQNRQAIQVLEEARDAVQTLHVGSTYITTGSLDGHVRTYDLRKGELRSDYMGCLYFRYHATSYNEIMLYRSCNCCCSHTRRPDSTRYDA